MPPAISHLSITQIWRHIKIQDGGRRPSWISGNCCNFRIIQPIHTKFIWEMPPSNHSPFGSTAMTSYKSSRWRMAAILKSRICCNFRIIQPIHTKFMWKMLPATSHLPMAQLWRHTKIQDGGQRPSWFSKNRRRYWSSRSIFTKFKLEMPLVTAIEAVGTVDVW